MNKESVAIIVDPNIPEPYLGWIKSRNGKVASDIAVIQGMPYVGNFPADLPGNGSYYLVPSRTITIDQARELQITSEEDFYGVAVSSINLVNKAILHPSISLEKPDFYCSTLAQKLAGLVLPGVTVFSRDDLTEGFDYLRNCGFAVRLKRPDESDGNGQYYLATENDLQAIANKFSNQFVSETGLVLEANVQSPKTVSVGFCVLGRDKFSFLARQKNDQVSDEDGIRDRYLGADVQVVRGDFSNLFQIDSLTGNEVQAIETCTGFKEVYFSGIDIIASRLSFDYLYGIGKAGEIIGGVTDITGRVGGTDPALMTGIQELKTNPDMDFVRVFAHLNYCPEIVLPFEVNSRRYIDDSVLRITAGVC